MKIRRRQSGFGLLEVLISVLLVVAVGAAALSLQFNSFSLAERSSYRTSAYFLAKEGLEAVKIAKAKDPTLSLVADDTKFYGINDDLSLGSANDEAATKMELYGGRFLRYVTFADAYKEDAPGLYTKVTVTVCYDKAAVRKVADGAKLGCDDYKAKSQYFVESISVIKN